MTAVLGLLVALAALLVAGPRGRRGLGSGAEQRRRVSASTGAEQRRRVSASTGAVLQGAGARPLTAGREWRPPPPPGASQARAAPVGWTARLASRRRAQTRTGDLAAVVTTVSTLLRAGARPADAWARALRLSACGAVPTVDQLLQGAEPETRGRRRHRVPPGERARAQAVVAAAIVAQQLGAPLAAVLDEVAAAVVADAEAEAELDAALAGPRASVRVLLGLPVLGVLLGAAAGADPVAVLLDGRLGTASGVLGCGLAAGGWGWTRLLVARARRAAAP